MVTSTLTFLLFAAKMENVSVVNKKIILKKKISPSPVSTLLTVDIVAVIGPAVEFIYWNCRFEALVIRQ